MELAGRARGEAGLESSPREGAGPPPALDVQHAADSAPRPPQLMPSNSGNLTTPSAINPQTHSMTGHPPFPQVPHTQHTSGSGSRPSSGKPPVAPRINIPDFSAGTSGRAPAAGGVQHGDIEEQDVQGVGAVRSAFLQDLSGVRNQITFGMHGQKFNALDLKLLDEGSLLYTCARDINKTTIKTMPKAVVEPLWYFPVDTDNAELGGDKALLTFHLSRACKCFMQPLVLFPSSMRPPPWLLSSFTRVDEHVFFAIAWGWRSRMDMLLQWVGERQKTMKDQVLTVWYSNDTFGPGDSFTLNGANSNGEVTDWPYVPAFLIADDRAALTDVCHSWTRLAAERSRLSSHSLNAAAEEENETMIKEWVLAADRVEDSKISAVAEKLSLEDAIAQVVRSRNIKIIKLMLVTGHISKHFKAQRIGIIVERLAVDRNDIGLLMLLTHKTRKELSPRALQFLIHSWSVKLQTQRSKAASKRPEPSVSPDTEHQDIEQYLIKYIHTGRNPLSITASILQGLQDETRQYEESQRFMEEPFKRFRSLSLALLDEVLERDVPLPALHKLLYPSEVPNTIHDTSPLTVAFNTDDLDFVSHDLMFGFIKDSWTGRRFKCLTNSEDDHAVSVRNPLFAYRVLRTLGFSAGPLKGVLKFAMQTWHCSSFCSLAFYNSPRGRWSMHALCELAFLSLFQWIVLYPQADRRSGVVLFYLLFVFGNFLDVLNYTRLKYHSISEMPKYLHDAWNALNLATNVVLLILFSILTGDYWISPSPLWADNPTSWLHICLCTSSVLVWIRFLSLVQPVYPRLGPLLITVGKMMGEIVTFAVPYLFVLSGFATLFSGIYSGSVKDYSSWFNSMLTLFKSMLGGYNFDDFSSDKYDNVFPAYLRIYGCIVLVMYLIMVAILLLNLLVAIIVARYNPDSNERLAQFRQAQIVDSYSIQVRHNTVCSPLNLVHYCLFWLPNCERRPISLQVTRMLLLVNADGELHPDVHFLVPTGKGEFPYFAFLLTTYPVICAVAILCYFLCAPFAIWSYAFSWWMSVRKKWLHQFNKVNDAPDQDTQPAIVTYLRRPFDHIQSTLIQSLSHSQQKDAHRLIEYILQGPVIAVMLIIGTIIYVVLLGGIFLSFWVSLVWWLWKISYSLYMMFIYPWTEIIPGLARQWSAAGDSARGAQPAGNQVGDRAWIEDDEGDDDDDHTDRASTQAPVTPHRPTTALSRWKMAKQSVVEHMSLHATLDTPAVERALNHSLFAPRLADWKMPVIEEPVSSGPEPGAEGMMSMRRRNFQASATLRASRS